MPALSQTCMFLLTQQSRSQETPCSVCLKPAPAHCVAELTPHAVVWEEQAGWVERRKCREEVVTGMPRPSSPTLTAKQTDPLPSTSLTLSFSLPLPLSLSRSSAPLILGWHHLPVCTYTCWHARLWQFVIHNTVWWQSIHQSVSLETQPQSVHPILCIPTHSFGHA